MRFIRKHACLLLLIGLCHQAIAQPSAESLIYSTSESGSLPGSAFCTPSGNKSESFTIRNIYITGNKKTHPDIILRELPFQVDESYPLAEVMEKFQKARKNLMNSGLFQEVVVSLQSLSGNEVFVNVEVREKWYVWPKPFLRTVDKNFQQWWKEGNRDMNRINYGIKLTHTNFTGRNDKLNVALMNGYTRQVSLQYYGLFLDNELKWSVNGGFSVGKNREVNYMTSENRSVALKDDDYLRSYFTWFAELNYRPAIKTKHTLGIGYSYEKVDDTIAKLNPFFASNSNTTRLPELNYRMSYFDVDFIPYPTKGNVAEIQLKKKGFSEPVNLWQLTAKGSKYWSLSPKLFVNLSAVGMVKLPFRQPYITNQFIGHDNLFLQGYEYYVIDGVAGGYTKGTLTRKVLDTRIKIGKGRIDRLNDIPLKLFAKTYINAGYVHAPGAGTNSLSNRFVYSGGVGLDIVAFTDFVIKIEWSFNPLGDNGLYLHKRNYF